MVAATKSPLVSTEWLAERLESPDLVILDATFFLPNQGRNAREDYLHSHIPGAHFFDVDTIADHRTDLPHMLPTEDAFATAAGQFGIEEFTTVVVYDNNSFMASARAWWTFRAFGHDHVLVLDGGLARWQSLGLPTRSGPESVHPSTFTRPCTRGWCVTFYRCKICSIILEPRFWMPARRDGLPARSLNPGQDCARGIFPGAAIYSSSA